MRFLLRFACLMAFFNSPARAQERPNMILFIADDVSAEDLGCYGHSTVQTPAIDRLASSGMRFENAYLTTSSCSPSRCSIITGRFPHNTGAPELHSTLPDDQLRFPELLRGEGYYTVLSGKNHMFGNRDRAFEKITAGGGPGKSEDWVGHVKNRPKNRPFFFWFAAADAHRPWQFTETDPRYEPSQAVVPPYLIDGEKTRQDLADYYHEVSRWDRSVGQVTSALREEGLLDNTLIVVMADNGRPFPRCKTRLYDSGIRTPLVVHFPALVKKPAVSRSLVSAVDLAATFLELAGIDPPQTVQGVSLVPILKDPAATVRDVAFAEHNWHVFRAHERMVRFGDFLYIRNNYPELQNRCLEAIQFPSGEELAEVHAAGRTTPAQQNIFRQPCPPEEFFQVSEDPNQLNNLVGEPAFSKNLAEARKLLDEWTRQTGDSIPSDPTPDRAEDKKAAGAGRNPHREFPGALRGADKILHPGPIRSQK